MEIVWLSFTAIGQGSSEILQRKNFFRNITSKTPFLIRLEHFQIMW